MNGISEEDESRPMIVRVVSEVLERLICGHANSPKNCPDNCNGFLKFKSSYAPEVSIEAYLTRIRKYSRCSDACMVMALVYVDRLIETKGLVLSSLNVHRLLITSVMLAAKFHDDLFYNNAYYSKLGGISLQELNHLEIELLQLLDNSLFVSEDFFSKYIVQLQNFVHFVVADPISSSLSTPVERAVSVPVKHNPVKVPAGLSMSVPRIPSPDNPHAEYTFGEYSPCRIGPASITPPRNSMINQHIQAQQYAHQQAAYVQKYYSTGWTAEAQTQNVTPRVDFSGAPRDGPPKCYSYHSGSVRDSGDDATTTSCSTRTNSPYVPADISRNCSTTMIGGYSHQNGLQESTNRFGGYGGLAIHTDLNNESGGPATAVLFPSSMSHNHQQPTLCLQYPGAMTHYDTDSMGSCNSMASAVTDPYGGLSLRGLQGNHSDMIESAFSVDDAESTAYVAMHHLSNATQHPSSYYPLSHTNWPSHTHAVVSPVHTQPLNEADLLIRYQQCSAQFALSQLYGTDALRPAPYTAPAWSQNHLAESLQDVVVLKPLENL